MRSLITVLLLLLFVQVTFTPPVVGKTVQDKKIQKLIKILKKSRKVSERSDAAWDLGKLGAEQAVPALTEALKDSARPVRANSATSLGKLGDAAKPAIPALKELLNDKYGKVVLAAGWALEKHGVPSSELVPAYRRVLKDPSAKLRLSAAQRLYGDVPPQDLFSVVLECSRESDFDTKRDAGKLLRKLTHPKAKNMIPLILDALKSSVNIESEVLISAISEFNPKVKEALPILNKYLRSSKAPNRSAAARALEHFGEYAKGSVPALIDLAKKDKDLAVRKAAIGCLGKLGPIARSAVPGLMEIAENDRYPEIRADTMSALGEIGPAAKIAVPLLKTAYKDPDRRISTAARNALFRLDPSFKPTLPKKDHSARKKVTAHSSAVPLFQDSSNLSKLSEKGRDVAEITIYKDFAIMTVKDPQSPEGWSKYTYRNGIITGPDTLGASGDKTTPFSLIDFSLISKMAKDAPGLLESSGTAISHIIFKGKGKKGTWMVYVGQGMASKGYVIFKLNGKVKSKKKF